MSDLLRVLSDAELLSRTRDLVALERAVTLRLLLHLNEIERRQLHLEQGFSSMFDYCTSGLGYSEPAAFRRIRTARCIARFPEVLSLLEANKLSLSTVTRVSRALTESNKDSLLARVIGCSVRKVDEIVAEYLPVTQLRDLVRAVVVHTPKDSGPTLLATTPPREDASASREPEQTERPPQTDCEKSAYCRVEGNFHPIPTIERRVRFHFSTSEVFQQKLEKVRALAWHRLPTNASLEHVLELVLDSFIERNDPLARRERRTKRSKTIPNRVGPGAATSDEASSVVPSTRRAVPSVVRDEVFARDGNRCAFVGKFGRRCEATVGLQVDHIVPVARGGVSTLGNLRLLCAYHNRFEARRIMPPHQETEP